MASIYVLNSGSVSLAAGAPAKSVSGIRSGATFSLLLKQLQVSFDGISSTAAPVLLELCQATFATNPPGTASTAKTPIQGSGRVLASGVTGAANWTTEPTVVTVLEDFLIHPQTGVIYQIPLGDEYDTAFSEGFVLRGTSVTLVNLRSSWKWTRG